MPEVTFARCPKCQCANWCDIPHIDYKERVEFICDRCGYRIKLGSCSVCKARDWDLVKGIDKLGGHRPYYRLRCRSCGRLVGFLIAGPP
jgi:hypothetical protein